MSGFLGSQATGRGQDGGQGWTYVNLIHIGDRGRRTDGTQAVANAFIQGHAPEGTVVPSPPSAREGMEVTDLPRLGPWSYVHMGGRDAKCPRDDQDPSEDVPDSTCLSRECRCVCAQWGHFQGLSPVVALINGVDHVLVHQAWLLVTLPPSLLLAGARRAEGRKRWRGGIL